MLDDYIIEIFRNLRNLLNKSLRLTFSIIMLMLKNGQTHFQYL